MCTECQDITKKVSKIGLPNQTSKIWHILAVFSGLGAYFSKLFFALKPWVQAGRFEYNEPYNPKNFFSHLYKGEGHFQYAFSKGRWSRKTLKFWEVYLFIHWNDISHGQNQRPNLLQIGTPYCWHSKLVSRVAWINRNNMSGKKAPNHWKFAVLNSD